MTFKDTVTQPPRDQAIRLPEHVAKPWGHEEIFALVEGSYVGKLLHISAGQSLSLQYHHAKDETIALISGRVELDLGPDADTLRAVTLSPGDSVHVTPGMLHRLRAVEDSVLVEASTAAPGWREDVVRLEDRYGRLGTTAP
jgi:mannose-6-phosphate isomerase